MGGPLLLRLNKSNTSYRKQGTFLDLNLCISDDTVSTKIKRDDFDFDIANFPFLDGDVPYGDLIRFARASLSDFKSHNKTLTAKLLRQGYRT